MRMLSVMSGAVLAVTLTLAGPVSAQNYPNKPVRVIVPLAPGGATDIQARLFSQKLTQALGQTFLVDNRSGAGGMIAFNYVVQQATPDGYTLLATSPGFTNAPALYEKPPFDPQKDFEPIILMSKAPYVLVVNPKFPAKTMGEFLAWGKANPGKLNFAISGVGTTIHLAQVWLADLSNLKMTVVPYKGTGPATQDLIAGQVHAAFANVISASQHIKAGRIRPLAVTTTERATSLPDLPTFAEAGLVGYEVTTWHGWLGPKGTPRAIVTTLNAALNDVLKDHEVARVISNDGGIIIGGTPEAFRKHVGEEIERWRRLVKIAGIKPKPQDK
ncbi:MAG: tripartite tricarboxylate transporter substrate binding protein [Betaproteobacteria bacterium]|nr:MAG: tripartite tricarboxylate transporter substrate binding protein [Betaproteobacteria bacterium]